MSSTSNSDASSTAHPSRISRPCAVVGFGKTSVEPSPDVQHITGHCLPPPPTTYTTHQDEQANSDLVSDFFGAGKPAVSGPPPYTPYGHKVVETQAGICMVEPQTLARMLFLYGFCKCALQFRFSMPC